MLNMKNDFILDENFWQNYRLCSDYEILEIRINDNEKEHLLSDMNARRSRLQILSNESLEAKVISRRVFERLIRKETKIYLYVVRDSKTEIFEFVKTSEELASIQQTIEHSELNRTLSLDLLKIFRSDLSNESFSKRSKNHSIYTDDARFVNKSSY